MYYEEKIIKKVLILTLTLLLFGTGVFAGTVISTYKTNRGNFATIEREDVHKNRIALKVNGKSLKNDSWYADGVTYVPLREAAEMLGAEVNYISSTQTAEINTIGHKDNVLIKQSDLPYTLKSADNKFILTINSFKATTSGVTMNITATNNHSNDAYFNLYDWRFYANNQLLTPLGLDNYLSYNQNLKTGKTVTGDVYYKGLPTDVDRVIAEFQIRNWLTNNTASYTFELEV